MTAVFRFRRLMLMAFGIEFLTALAQAYSRGTATAPWAYQFGFAVSFTIGVTPIVACLSAGVAAFAAIEMMVGRSAEADIVAARPVRAVSGPVAVGTLPAIAAMLAMEVIAWLQVALHTGKVLLPFDLVLVGVAFLAVIAFSVIGACVGILWPRQYTPPFVVTAGLLGIFFGTVNTSFGRVLQIAGGTAPPTGLVMHWSVIGWWLLALVAVSLSAVPLVVRRWRRGLGQSPPTWLSAALVIALLGVGLVVIPQQHLGTPGHEFARSTALPADCSTRSHPRACVWDDEAIGPNAARRALAPSYHLLRREDVITSPVTYYTDVNGRQMPPGNGSLSLVTKSDGRLIHDTARSSVLTTRECSRTISSDRAALAYYKATTVGGLWLTARMSPNQLPHLSTRQRGWLRSSASLAWMKSMVASMNTCRIESVSPPHLWASFLE